MYSKDDGVDMADRQPGIDEGTSESRTAAEAGWRVSRYNLSAPVPESGKTAIVNLYKGNCALYTSLELYLLSVLDELDEHHPIIERFAKRGIICNFDERAALESKGRAACAAPHDVSLTICPTMGCNFDCPYCFENHGGRSDERAGARRCRFPGAAHARCLGCG